MAGCLDVVLYLGYDTSISEELSTYLELDIAKTGQHLHRISSREQFPHGHIGSGQAGALRIYAGLIRRGYISEVDQFFKEAPWSGESGIAIFHDENFPPLVKTYGGGAEQVHFQEFDMKKIFGCG